MGRFTVVQQHTILDTDQIVWYTPMSAASSFEYRDAVFAALSSGVEPKEADSADALKSQLASTMDLRPKMLAAIAAHTFDDEAATVPTFDSPEAVAAELSEAQLNDLWAVIASRAGFTGGAAKLAERFPDNGAGEAGSVPAPSDGGEVRPAA